MTRSKKIITAMILAATAMVFFTCYITEKLADNRNVHAENVIETSEVESISEETTCELTTMTSTIATVTSTVTTQKTTTAMTTTAVTTTTTEPEEQYMPLEDLIIYFDMDVSQPTGLSKEDFMTLINNLPCDYCGYYKRNGEVFWEACNEMGVNEIFACAIAAWESDWGRIAGWGKNNYFGISGGSYATEAEGVRALVKLLAHDYLDESGTYYNGKTITGVSYFYCEPDEWPYRVYDCMCTIVTGC